MSRSLPSLIMDGCGDLDSSPAARQGQSMKVRLIKPDASIRKEKAKRQPVEVPIIETIRSWVREFQSSKATRDRLDFERISNQGKT